jgi:hypothetical protein
VAICGRELHAAAALGDQGNGEYQTTNLVTNGLVSALFPLRLEIRHICPVSGELAIFDIEFPTTSPTLLDAAECEKAKCGGTDTPDSTADTNFSTLRQFRQFLANCLRRCLIDLLLDGGVTPKQISK